MSNFSFSNLNNSDESSEYETWAQKIKTQYNSFGKPSNSNFGAWKRRANKPEESEDESDAPSPELWKKPDSTIRYPVECRERNLSHISSNSRAQTIAKYRQEMLELVRHMPESNYELSLRDIVESPKITTPLQEKEGSSNKKEKKKKKEKKTISRSQNMELDKGGLLLKMFVVRIPSVLGGRKSVEYSENRAKVSPSRDREWWSDGFGQMTSSSGSSGSSNSSGRRKTRKLTGCCPFFQTR